MEKLDPRLNAYRHDLADERLHGKVDAKRFVKGDPARIGVPVASVFKVADIAATQLTQALFGELIYVFEVSRGWAWVQLSRDGYVGYVHESTLMAPTTPPTHYVCNVCTIVFPNADIKAQPAWQFYQGSELKITDKHGAFALLHGTGAVHAKHLSPIGVYEKDFVAVAECFLNVPYYWGGKTLVGLDCSGLVQISLQAAGIEALRDSDMQEKSHGTPITDHNKLTRGDLVFWPGHVGIMQSATQLLHANGHHMKVSSERLSEVIARSEKPIRSLKRLTA